jgi:hypothetical protein
MQRSRSCAHWRANGAGLPRPCGPVRRRRSSRDWRRRAWGPSGWAHRCGAGGQRNKTRSCAGSRQSFQRGHPALVRIPSGGMWPRQWWKRTAVRRGRGDTVSGDCGRSNGRCGPPSARLPRPGSLRPQGSRHGPLQPKPRQAARLWGWIRVQPCAASCTTIQGGPCRLLGAVWPQPGETYAPHCSGIARGKKGANA